MKYSLIALLSASSLAMSLPSFAQETIQWSGFGNIAAGATTGSGDSLFGYDEDIDFNPESLFALQAKAILSDKLSVTTQFIARGAEDFDLDVEWAYVQYQLTDTSSVNVGKLRLPLYVYSDSLDVGYSYHWLRTPASVYRVPFDNYTGVSFQHTAFVDDWMINTQILGGNVKDEISVAGATTDAEINNMVGLNTSVNINNWTARLGYFQTNDTNIALQGASATIDTLLQTLEQVGANYIIEELDVEDDRGTFAGVGIMYDNFDWFVGAEYTELEVENSYIPKQRSSYITAGKRFGDWTIHATYAKANDKINDPARLTIANAQLQQAINVAATAQIVDAEYSSIGGRYELTRNAALKFDLTRADDQRIDNSDIAVAAAIQFIF